MKIYVKVKPASKKYEVEKIEEAKYIVSIKEKPENNQANIAVIKLLSKHFNVESKNIRIISGVRSRNKILEIKL